jgi:hypothetical protein
MPKRKLLLTALVLASLLLLVSAPQVEADPLISVGSYTVPATPLEPFLVPIEITGAVNVDFWQFNLTYDPTDLQINDPAALDFLGRPVTEGDFFLNVSPFNVFNPGFIILDAVTLEQTGLLLAVNNTFGGSLPGPSGSGILAFVEFVAIGEGDSLITVTDAVATSSAVPEPMALALFTSGLALLGARGRLARRRRRDKF